MAVALSEAIINAIDHGNLELDSELRQDDERIYHRLGDERRKQSPYRERRVRVSVGVTRSEATFTIRDEGPGFDVDDCRIPPIPLNLCRIGGQGLLFIRTPHGRRPDSTTPAAGNHSSSNESSRDLVRYA